MNHTLTQMETNIHRYVYIHTHTHTQIISRNISKFQTTLPQAHKGKKSQDIHSLIRRKNKC